MISIGFALIFGVAAAGAAPRGCPSPVPARDLTGALIRGDIAFAALDDVAFATARAETAALLPCVGEALPPGLAAAVHRQEALAAFLAREPAAAVTAFRAVQAATPDARLDPTLAPPGHPLGLLFQVAAGLPDAPSAPLPTPAFGWLQVDGAAGRAAPVDRPYVLQHLDPHGRAVLTARVQPGSPTPDYATAPGRRGPPSSRQALRLGLGAGALALGAAAGAVGWRGEQAERAYWDPSLSPGAAEAMRARANAAAWTATGLGGAAVALGTAAVFLRADLR